MECDCKKHQEGFAPKVVIPEQKCCPVMFRLVKISASMGDDTVIKPENGLYRNVILNYEANNHTYLYSSDGVPTRLNNGITNYDEATNLPKINSVTLIGNKTSADLRLADAPKIITIKSDNTSWEGADTAEDVYNFFINRGKVSIIFEGSENNGYQLITAAYIEDEQKLMGVVVAASTDHFETTEFNGNALLGVMTLYTENKAVDVGEIELQPKLFVTDFTGLSLDYNELSGVPATTYSIGMVKPGDGLEVASDGALSVSDIEQYVHVFDTVADMEAATDLVNGDYAKTLGFYSINDGGSAYYIITDAADSNKFQISIGDLYAEVIDLKSFKQMGKFNDAITASEFNLMPGKVIDLEGNTLTLTSTLTLSDITIRNGYVAMGTSSASIAPSYDTCLSVQSNVTIENVEFDNIDAYYTIISERGAKNITIEHCKFIDNAFSCIYFEVGNENIKVNKCYFDGIKYTVTSQFGYRYFIATGSRHTTAQNTDYTFYVRNAEFTNNTCLNNPLWEGIDSHGGENMVIKNNYIYNCQTGIMCASSGRFIANPKHCNIVIENNIIDGTPSVTRCGIVAGGGSDSGDGTRIIAENIRISNNKITKGNTLNNVWGAISIRLVKGFEVSNNYCSENEIHGLYLGNIVIDGNISHNYFDGKTYPIRGNYTIINVNICNNTLNGLGSASYAFQNSGSGRGKFEANLCYACTNNYIHYPNAFYTCLNGSTLAYVQQHDVMLDWTNNKVYKVTSNYVALGRTAFQNTMTVSGEQNASYVTCNREPTEIIDGLALTINGDEYVVDHITYDNKIYFTTNLVNQYTNATMIPKAPVITAIIE